MPDHDGLRFVFAIQDKISAKLAKLEARAKTSIDQAFSKASRAVTMGSAAQARAALGPVFEHQPHAPEWAVTSLHLSLFTRERGWVDQEQTARRRRIGFQPWEE